MINNNNIEFWEKYYEKNNTVIAPTKFAEWVHKNFGEIFSSVIDIGCGNGRDSIYFQNNSKKVIGIDSSSVAINYLNKINIDGICESAELINFSNIIIDNNLKLPILYYSRFFLHSISENIANKLIDNIFESMSNADIFAMEFRTINDPLIDKGEKLSSVERYTDHYRRFIDFKLFINQLKEKGFQKLFNIENNGLAIHLNEDPVVGRIVLSR